MRLIIEKLRNQNIGTPHSNYYTVWKLFNKFLMRLDKKPENWNDRLVLFVGYLVNEKRQSSTVRSYISAIKTVLMDDGFDISEDQYLIKSLTRACRLTNDKIKTRLPIHKGLLNMIITQIRKFYHDTAQPYLAVLFSSLISTAYYGLFRVGELTSGTHPVLARDVQVAKNKNKMLFVLRTSKTHGKSSRPQMVKISSAKTGLDSKLKPNLKLPKTTHCPFKLLQEYLSLRGPYKSMSEPFFILADRSVVTPIMMSTCLKSAIKTLGFDETLYSTHSLRAGRTDDLLKLGLSVESIKKIGRWKSNAIYKYLQ